MIDWNSLWFTLITQTLFTESEIFDVLNVLKSSSYWVLKFTNTVSVAQVCRNALLPQRLRSNYKTELSSSRIHSSCHVIIPILYCSTHVILYQIFYVFLYFSYYCVLNILLHKNIFLEQDVCFYIIIKRLDVMNK